MIATCKNCPDRAMDCHAKCEKYALFVAENEHVKQQRRLDHISPNGVKMMSERSLRKKMRRA